MDRITQVLIISELLKSIHYHDKLIKLKQFFFKVIFICALRLDGLLIHSFKINSALSKQH